MSAAVIGRQLRQQATTGRTSGPLVPPQAPGKGRPRTPSHAPTSGRPYSPAPASMTGTSGERYNVIPGAGGGGGGPGASHLNYPSSHSGLYGEKERNKGEEPKLQCTWHCFCVALKALSGGLVLFVAGTIMSVVGFVADANHNSTQTLSNDTVIETPLPSVFRNLTFAGPVIMGLGGIVIVAALVLTFEVRDTLGVKVVPAKPSPRTAPPGNSALPTLTNDSNTLYPTKDSKGEVGASKKPSTKSTSNLVLDQRKEAIPSIASTMSPENRVSNQSIEASAAKKLTLDIGHSMNQRGSTQTGKEQLKGPSISTAPMTNGKHPNGDPLNNQLQQQHHHLSVRNGSSGATRGKVKLDPSSLTIPFDILSDLGPVTGSFHRQRLGDTETAFNGLLPLDDPLIMDSSRSRVQGSKDNKVRQGNNPAQKQPSGYQAQPSSSAVDNANNLLASLSSGTASLSHVISPNLESFYFALPSPQETELSDPDGCSLTVPTRWRSSRCSCSASPTHSMSMELYLDQKDPPINIKIIEQQRIQEQLIIQQQILLKQQQDQLQRLIEQANLGRTIPFRRPKVLASIESDGLSSTSSSSDDLFVPLRRSRPSSSTSPFNNQTYHHPHQSSSAPHYQHHHQQLQLGPQPRSSQKPTPATTYQQSTSSMDNHPLIGPGPTSKKHDDDEPLVSSSFGFRSELSSEFSSNASELDSPLNIDLDEDLTKTLARLRSPIKSTSFSRSKSKGKHHEESEEKEDEPDATESTRLLPSSSTAKSSLSPTITLNRPDNSSYDNTPNEKSSSADPTVTNDKRFPLLREVSLSNGSVPNRKR
ncbi:uncharacterized protein LOC107365386 isoform X2 [Tetranychus urticae]|nr:uncharacterized protein LOC107365386 isoform X2 [Tetranychus urticae]